VLKLPDFGDGYLEAELVGSYTRLVTLRSPLAESKRGNTQQRYFLFRHSHGGT
jgi:hypothetical protein